MTNNHLHNTTSSTGASSSRRTKHEAGSSYVLLSINSLYNRILNNT